MDPQPPEGTELSTGTPRGSESNRLDGVAVPGVAGGVKAGDSSELGGGAFDGVPAPSLRSPLLSLSLLLLSPSLGVGGDVAEVPTAGSEEKEKSGCDTSASPCDECWASVGGE